MVSNVFVAGGTGFVGSYIIKALVEKGFKVTLLSKSSQPAYFHHSVNVVSGDILYPDSWKESLRNCHVFINLVGIIREFPKQNITFEKLHVEAADKIINLCKEFGIKRLIHMSACGASPLGVSKYLVTKYMAEEIVRASGIDYTILRPSLIFGSNDKTVNDFANIIKMFGIFPIFGKGDYKLQPIYAGDVAEVFAKCITHPFCINKTFCLGGTEIFDYISFIKHIAAAIDKKVYLPLVPVGIIRIITRFMGRFKFYPLTSEQLEMLLAGNVCGECEIFSELNINRMEFDKYLEDVF